MGDFKVAAAKTNSTVTLNTQKVNICMGNMHKKDTALSNPKKRY